MSAQIVAALVVPSPPLQLAAYAGSTDPGADLRERSVDALAALLAEFSIDEVVVLTGHEREPRHTRGAVGARVAARLLDEAGWAGRTHEIVVPFDATDAEVAAAAAGIPSPAGPLNDSPGDRVLLLVPADLSAKRTVRAPGHFDERAEGVDNAVLGALHTGDAAALAALDPHLCADLWLTGRAALQTLATLMPTPRAARLLWADAPYGVQYVLARWAA